MASLNDENEKLNAIVELIENTKIGTWLNGEVIAKQVGCDVFIVDAFFRLWESQGLGYKSSIIGEYRYFVNS